MKKLIVASNNKNKIIEIKEILSKYSIEVLSLKEANINIDVEEDGTTFMENAYKKANEIHKILKNEMVLADDSGLVVDCLDGAPGVYSARFAGEHGNNKKNNKKLLELLKEKDDKDKKAKFVCAMVLISDTGKVIKVQGEIEGIIINEERGSNGFGYDPVFYIPEYKMTFAQMKSDLKNSISHRANALKELEREIINLMGDE
ncbi:nucleoside-triphosphate diphosphatase [Clostridium carboxidivorans P7]|uniref:dITP/XTP pyrophosphatase n=1 Tax=Clostridium carboxidivorans P7 TaxID=536227 RepID=C6Q2F3_9CLOT|nr:XTP/dITP diphosphatase [Clostridium carboxidivorans]AKN32704.1 nucleoside-triphosphate diphosphatase [Clostridium carboxidivorans P7]EET84331.1 non-canonical purine NTP pyrophosphatase, rdgB/HAM1 family [Clostridium carboxidivorans P7]EFG90060.1 non-canonical purine NTP pyrophosphatase, RdgB/HAM1 family [Clostridium carboxidivorans P7]